ncbi:hypothetical protein, partial [Faecalibacterium sp.]
PLILPERKRRQFQIVLFRFKGSKVIPSSVVPKFAESVCAESSDLSIAFLPGSGYNQTIDSNGAVGHLLTRSAVFVKMLSYFWVRHCGRPECRRKGKKNKIK